MLITNVLIFNLVIALSYTISTMAILFTKFCMHYKGQYLKTNFLTRNIGCQCQSCNVNVNVNINVRMQFDVPSLISELVTTPYADRTTKPP